jgi:hypothetical protein
MVETSNVKIEKNSRIFFETLHSPYLGDKIATLIVNTK